MCTPDIPNSVTFVDLLVKLDDHFSSKPSEFLCRFKFNKRDQKRNETIFEFMAELRKLSENSNFGTQLDSMLRDRLVCGVLDEEIRRKLVSDPKLTLMPALDLTLSGSEQATEIQGTLSNTVNHIKPKVSGKNAQECKSKQNNKNHCHRCGNHHHYGECKSIKAICNYYHCVGHIAKACNSKKIKQETKISNKINITRFIQGPKS